MSTLALVIAVTSLATAEDIVEVRQLGAGRLEATLSSTEVLSEAEAQRILLPHIERACGTIPPMLGRYRFESNAPLVTKDPDATSSFRFVQQATCGSASESPEAPTESGVAREDLSQELEAFISEASVYFLTDRATGEFARAYAAMSRQLQSFASFLDWTESARASNVEAGPVVSVDIWRITVYENPVRASQPGLYIAADYEATFEQLPLQCGYLMWFRTPDNRFAIVREERAVIPAEFIASTPTDRLPQVMAQMGCTRALQEMSSDD